MKYISIGFISIVWLLMSAFQTSYTTPEAYGAKADFRRDQVSTTATTKQITCPSCAFTSADIGKVVAVKNSQIDAAYRATATTTNAKIVSVQSYTTATLDSTLDVTNTTTEMLWGTNNFGAFQTAIDSCFAKGISELVCGPGTYYIVPAKAQNVPTYSGIKGLAIRGSLRISGFATTLKFGEEDVERVNVASIYAYAAIHMVGDGNKELVGLTIEAPDRVSTETAYTHTNCIYTQQTANIRQNVTVKDCYIKGQWSEGFLSSRGGKWNQLTGTVEFFNDYRFERCSIEAKRHPLVVFTNDGPTKRIWVADTELNGGGAINQGMVYCGANISAGSTTLTITGNPSFSWYDFVSQYSNSRKPFVVVGGNFGAFSSSVVSITSPTVAVLANAPTSSYTCDTLKWYLNNDFVEGHAVYLHPNISCSFKNVKLKNVNGYGFHIYSGGGQPGSVQFMDFDNVDTRTPTGLQPQNLIPGDNMNVGPFMRGRYATIRNCNDFAAMVSAKCRAFNSTLSCTFSDTTELYNCKGRPTFNGAGKRYTLHGGDYYVLYCNASQATTTAIGTFANMVYLGASCNSAAGLNWSAGGIGGFSIQLDSAKLAQSGTFNFQNVGANTPIYYGMGYPTNWSEGTKALFKTRFQAPEINLVQDIDPNAYKTDPRGVFTFRNAASPKDVWTINPTSQKVNEYESWTKAAFLHNYNRHRIALPSTTKLQGLYPVGPSANGNLYGQNLSAMYHYRGVCEFETVDTVMLTWGGLFRIRFSGARNAGEVVRLRLDPYKLLWFEEPGTDHSRATIPIWAGVNGEVVYNSAPTGVQWWEHRITTAATAETVSPTFSGTTVEFDLAHTPYLGFREITYIPPASLFTLSVPLAGGQTETFTAGVHGELIGNRGSTGALRMTDGHAKLVMATAANQSGTITATYNYVSASSWNGVGQK